MGPPNSLWYTQPQKPKGTSRLAWLPRGEEAQQSTRLWLVKSRTVHRGSA